MKKELCVLIRDVPHTDLWLYASLEGDRRGLIEQDCLDEDILATCGFLLLTFKNGKKRGKIPSENSMIEYCEKKGLSIGQLVDRKRQILKNGGK